jgi:tetratricopeptide (TPR) repeat protein
MDATRKIAPFLITLAAAGCGAGTSTPAGGVRERGLCEGGLDLPEIWNDGARLAIREAHGADAGAPGGDGNGDGDDLGLLGELVIARVDELAADLEATTREACAAHRRGQIDEAEFSSIGGCLAEVRDGIAGAVAAARRGRKEDSTEVVLGLAMGPARRLEGCSAAALSSGSEPDSAAELLARGRAEAAGGDIGEALAFLERADDRYAGDGDALGREVVALEMGHVAAAAGLEDAALQMYGKAARHCLAAAAETPARREEALAILDEVAAAFTAALGPEHPRTRAVAAARERCVGDGSP